MQTLPSPLWPVICRNGQRCTTSHVKLVGGGAGCQRQGEWAPSTYHTHSLPAPRRPRRMHLISPGLPTTHFRRPSSDAQLPPASQPSQPWSGAQASSLPRTGRVQQTVGRYSERRLGVGVVRSAARRVHLDPADGPRRQSSGTPRRLSVNSFRIHPFLFCVLM